MMTQLDHGCHLVCGNGDLHSTGRTETLERSKVTHARPVEPSIEMVCR